MKHPNFTLSLIALTSLSAMPIATMAQAAETGVYKIPAGEYLEVDLFLLSQNIQWKERGNGKIRFDYRLPKEIDGANPKKIVLESASAAEPLKLTGPDADAICTVVVRDVECAISYRKNADQLYEIDTVAANAYLQSQNYSPPTIELMQKGQQSIMHEAAGKMYFRLR